jgi:glucokinase
MAKHRIGMDLGGTKLLGVLVDKQNTVIDKTKLKIPTKITLDDLIIEFKNLIEGLSGNYKIDKIGVALPGPVQQKTGIATFLPAYGWKNVDFKTRLEEILHIQVSIDNDVNMATLAEYKLGAGRGVKSLYTFYPGTGIGGGYIAKGQLVRGFNGTAGEIGHMVMDINGTKCNCGQNGCLETIVSNTAFKRLLKELIDIGKYKGQITLENSGSKEILKAWNSGDAVLIDLLKYQARILGIAIGNIINITGVERIIVGGHFYHVLGDKLLPIVKKNALIQAIGNGMNNVEIVLNQLGSEAPALGSTLL